MSSVSFPHRKAHLALNTSSSQLFRMARAEITRMDAAFATGANILPKSMPGTYQNP